MGLSSILIGGMGIVNTMNVVVSRRMLEIAVLKTLGLKAWRITVLFLVEAALMGIIGSLIGLGSGIVLSYFIRGVGEEVLQTSLSWRAYPEAWYSGVSLGVVITMVFGFLPTLNAGQIRPIGVLRPNDIQLPNAGMTRTLAALLFAMLLFGFTLNTIVSGRLDLPITLMLGLGGFIIGLFGGVILANEGLLDEVGASEDNPLVARSIPVLSLTLGAFALVGLGVVNLFLSPLSLWLVYLLPMVLGGGAYLLLRALAARYAHLPYQAARLARQVLLWGGAAILGGLLGGGLFALWRSVLLILYPREATPPGLNTAIAASLILGLIALFSFRLRARRAASLVGLALIGAAVLSIIGFGLGDVLESLFGGMGFWEPVEEFSTGVIVVQIIVLLLGGIFVAMNGLVWLLARLPSFGSVDVKLAFRNINARRNRTAATMIGLIAGIGALALITLTTSGVTSLLEGQLETNVGGNVVIISRDPDTGLAVKKRLESSLEGVNSFTQYNIMRGRILAINGEDPPIEGLDFGDAADGNSREFGRSEVEEGIGFAFVTIDPSEYQPGFIMEQGDWFTAEDVNERVMVLREPPPGSFLDRLDLDVGDTITWRMFANTRNGGQVEALDITYTIVGIISDQSEESGASDALQAPVGSLPATVSPESVVTVADIQEEHVDAALLEFAQISNAFALEISFLVGLIEQLLNQLIAIPALVALLALVAGVAIIANTVALDTQERRTQIGIMKALGLKGYRVLAQLMFENTFIGLISGLIGVGIGLIVTVLVGVLGDARQVEQTLDLVPALRLIAVSVIVSMVATLLSAWTAARESPMNVLRYE
jgi:ABC-type antimicrobial peptide transport system permease subunit